LQENRVKGKGFGIEQIIFDDVKCQALFFILHNLKGKRIIGISHMGSRMIQPTYPFDNTVHCTEILSQARGKTLSQIDIASSLEQRSLF
jgi:hypothetical protein